MGESVKKSEIKELEAMLESRELPPKRSCCCSSDTYDAMTITEHYARELGDYLSGRKNYIGSYTVMHPSSGGAALRIRKLKGGGALIEVNP
jgi:hypothetical protein